MDKIRKKDYQTPLYWQVDNLYSLHVSNQEKKYSFELYNQLRVSACNYFEKRFSFLYSISTYMFALLFFFFFFCLSCFDLF